MCLSEALIKTCLLVTRCENYSVLCSILMTAIAETCVVGGNVYGRVPEDPTKYYWIANGQIFEMSCGEGTVFDLYACGCIS